MNKWIKLIIKKMKIMNKNNFILLIKLKLLLIKKFNLFF